MLHFSLGLWGSLVALEVWDLSTPVQIRAAPFNPKLDLNLQIPNNFARKNREAKNKNSSEVASCAAHLSIMEKDLYFVAVKLFLEDSEGNLFIFRDKFSNSDDWDLPGGRLLPEEFNASFEKIIERKIREELGSKIKYNLVLEDPIIMRHARKENSSNKEVHILALGYCAKYLGGEINIGKNHTEHMWMNIKNFNPKKYFKGGWLEGFIEYQRRYSK